MSIWTGDMAIWTSMGRELGIAPSANAKRLKNRGISPDQPPLLGRPDLIPLGPAWSRLRPSHAFSAPQNTRCSVSRMLMHAEIAKCLISLTSLIPVIAITGNSGSLAADSFGRRVGSIERPPRRAGVRRGAALAGFRTMNLTAKSIFALSPRGVCG